MSVNPPTPLGLTLETGAHGSRPGALGPWEVGPGPSAGIRREFAGPSAGIRREFAGPSAGIRREFGGNSAGIPRGQFAESNRS